MLLELVRTTTPDGIRLDGSFVASETVPGDGLDAVIMLHGVGGSFYGGSLFESMVPDWRGSGVAVLRVNTRGHHSVNIAQTATGPKWYGAAFETVADCVHDIAGWASWLEQRGYRKLGVLGHSLGAIKALYSAAEQPRESIRCLVAASPPRLSYSAFQNSPQSNVFFASMSTARELLEAEQPEKLFLARFPVPLLMSAASYVDKYGPDERYHFLRFLHRIDIPTLFTYGSLELEQGGVAFAGLPDAIRKEQLPSQSIEVATVAGADHFYSGVHDSLSAAIIPWVQRTFS
jgi:pimeloyl-ACP methyl ester carboxylesterase